ncbi:hypothetical protein CLAFUW4_06201 [Fulvia fulva]|uniref:Uncharacterized protein n=1 Tax=Passalora fulva TaxID=5499 RepID=A0A9Q8LI21_PASFU|nr:uncharacterized protein CLAFUR5_06345 [Fulvia fulva]KAK4624585.1 hypothetical protein CLAFUR4_06204 [Fulvia fulva]KAK4625430.1 hypothetical protein CLAFUR0_06208 [Fulvia fulva]UJO17786.1 hypothetical protein CLAFUR5_06345 [Fulvia fulva]WPV15086.1 hypothetical protein CLAFUW4_06201 [Fulvia fulva]WPV29534.1 hypothetical protein CLAFUW7_06197 [Fulvia fulva]
MLESMRKEAPLWKNSTLATLSRGRYVAEIFEDTEKLLEMRDAADGHDVYLFPDETRVRHAAESPSEPHQDRSSLATTLGSGSVESYPMLPMSPSFAPLKIIDNDDAYREPSATDGAEGALLRVARAPSRH